MPRISKSLYLASVFGGSFLAISALAESQTSGRRSEARILLVVAGLLQVYAGAMFLRLIHRSWAAIQDGHARMTPAKAVGLMLVPLFNLYWQFEVFVGFAKDFNSYISRHALRIMRQQVWQFVIFSVLSLAGFVVSVHRIMGLRMIPRPVAGAVLLAGVVAAIVVVLRLCSAVNALAGARS